MKKLIIITALLLGLTGCEPSEFENIHEGDLIFQTSTSSQSQAIQVVTHSKYSHMGLIQIEAGKHYVLEAVQPVKLTPLQTWIRKGQGEHYVVKRLKNAPAVLTPTALARMKKISQGYLGKNNDSQFDWSDDQIYCSELVWKIYKNGLGIEIGKPQRLEECDLSNPVVKTKLIERYGNHIPVKMIIISPEQMFRSELLSTILKK